MKAYNVAALEALEAVRKKKRQDETQSTPKLLEKLVWVRVIIAGKLVSVPVISFSIPSYAVDALLCRNLAFLPPSHGTLRITLLCQISCSCSGFYQIFSWARTSMDLFGNLGLTFGFCLYQNGDGRLYVDQNGSRPPQSQVLYRYYPRSKSDTSML